jgi:Uma2 family endonuclease
MPVPTGEEGITMATMPRMKPRAEPVDAEPLELHSGDHMTREEFHRIYEQMPEDFKAELIGGIVYVASPLKYGHGSSHMPLSTLFYLYQGSTPGVDSGDNTTVQLGRRNEPQPDLHMRIVEECGGQTHLTSDDYIAGAPELVAEIALSSRSLDLHGKKRDYRQCGVLEYLVLSLHENKLRWFDLPADQELHPDADDVYRIRTFPGLWIQGEALLANDCQRLIATLQQGLATPEHTAFVQKLAAAKQAKAK